MLSRVADNFYWIGRYTERMNTLSRLLIVQVSEVSEDSSDLVSAGWKGIFSSLNIKPPDENLLVDASKMSDDFLLADAYTLVDYLTFEKHHESSIFSYLHKVRENARQNQGQIGDLIWSHINKQYLKMKTIKLQDIWPENITDLYKETLKFTYLFYGLIQDSFYQNVGFQFINFGKNIERFQNITNIFENHLKLLIMTDKEEHDDLISLLLRCGAFHGYRHVHSLDLDFRKVIDFLIYDSSFPLSIKCSYERMKEIVMQIQEKTETNLVIYEKLAYIEAKLKKGYEGQPLFEFLKNLSGLAVQLHQDLNDIYLNYKGSFSLIKNEQQ